MKLNNIFIKIKEKIKKNTYLFIIIKPIIAYSIYFMNKISNYRLEKIRFYKKTGYKLNLKNPQSFSEKIIWKKIYDRNPLIPLTSDKYQVRSYIKKVLGEKRANEILIPLLYVTDKPETIPFEKLSPPFIIKPNHTSGTNIIVENSQFDRRKIINTCKKWIKTPFGLEKLEWAYQPIRRKIVIERLLQEADGSIPKDFKFHMFHGKCVYIVVIFNRMNNLSASRFDRKWKFISFEDSTYDSGPKIEKPGNYEMMLEISEKLSASFDYVRVDFYNIEGKIYFGELTHYPDSGTRRFQPVSFDSEIGKQWKIKPEYWK